MTGKALAGQFRLLYFASAASFTGKLADDLQAPLPLKDLFSILEHRYPGITKAVLSSAAITVNLDYVDFEVELQSTEPTKIMIGIIHPGDEVAIIPPVSSG